jgi:hypothetical protein
MNFVNFNTDRVVIVQYPPGAGGKFLVNSLALGSNAVFHQADFAQLQLKQGLSAQEKLDILSNRLKDIKEKWNDLRFCNLNFFGITNETYLEQYSDLKQLWPLKSIVQHTIEADCYFFITVHTAKYLEATMQVWPNAKIVVFENSEDFLKEYRSEYLAETEIDYQQQILIQLKRYWGLIRDPSWPMLPPTDINQLEALPPAIVQEINRQFRELYSYFLKVDNNQLNVNSIMNQHLDCLIQNKNVNFWNTSHYFSKDTTVSNIISLSQTLGIKNIDKDIVGQYYQQWINKIKG